MFNTSQREDIGAFNKCKSHGFTLIELLVVVAIVSLLAAILFPVFARARENARRASCMSNMKQMGLAIMQYTQDYDEYYPLAWYGINPVGTKASYIQTQKGTPGYAFKSSGLSSNVGNWITWMDMIYPYVKNTQAFRCPSFGIPSGVSDDEMNGNDMKGLQYLMNGAFNNAAEYSYDPGLLAGKDLSASGYRFASFWYATNKQIHYTSTPVSAVLRPAEAAMLLEARGHNCAYGLQGYASLIRNSGGAGQAGLQPHLEGMNLTFGDGHAKWMSSSQIIAKIGTNNSPCNLGNIKTTYMSCSTLLNPFLPN